MGLENDNDLGELALRTPFAETKPMDSIPPHAIPFDASARARFDALRRRVFDEIAQGAARWRLTWILPFHLIVLLLLIVRGESATRAFLQAAAVALLGGVLVASTLSRDRWVKCASFSAGLLSYFALLATTGGLASPLLVTGSLMMVGAAISLRDPPWLRSAVFCAFFVGFVTLAAFARSAAGVLPGPLQATAAGVSAEYVVVALLAALFSMIGVYRVGCTMTRGYERAALELAERREELCSENEDRTRALEGIAARLAHEVKNPLAAIKGLSSHMARTSSDPKAAERLAIVAAEADRLQSIVEGFLSFSRGLDDLNLAAVKPHDVARELAVLLELRAAEAGVALEVSGERDLVLDADPRKIRQALLNVVLNAIQASPRGSAVRVAVARDCPGARVTVRDDGPGMTPDVLERIRRPYFTTKEGGTGLGLAVARGLVEQHGGQLEFASALGKGTTVTLLLPMKAKRCARLPNPLRAYSPEGAETERPAVLPAGAR